MKKTVHKKKGQFKNPALMGSRFRGSLHGRGGLQVGEVTWQSILKISHLI